MSIVDAGVIAALLLVGVRVLRYRRNHDPFLRSALAAHGLTLIGSRPPRWFSTGPFPLVTGKAGNLQTEQIGINGEFWAYRIVRFTDPAGGTHEAWVRLYFEAFRLKEADWLPPLTDVADPWTT